MNPAVIPKESDVLKAIVQYLGMRGYLFRRNNAGKMVIPQPNDKMRFINVGDRDWPDLLGTTKDGRFFAIEVKSRTGRLTEGQERMLQRLVENHAIAFVARDVQDVIDKGF